MSDVERFGFYVIQEGVTDEKAEFVRASDYERLQSEVEAARTLCEIYYGIAASSLGEAEVRRLRDAAIDAQRSEV